jgi:predicted nicotinamide N-methyase
VIRAPRDLVTTHAVLARPVLVPELELYLVTPSCPLWRAKEADLVALGLDAPYWAFAWAGGQALARFILDHPERVVGRTVLDFGAGGGIVGLAAARAGAARVVATDLDPVAVAAIELNAQHLGLPIEATTEDLLLAPPSPAWSLIVAGDVTYEPEGAQVVLRWLQAQAQLGSEVWLAEPGRGFLDTRGLHPLHHTQAPADVDVEGRYWVPTTIYRVPPA